MENGSNRYIRLLIEFAETEWGSEMETARKTFFRNQDSIFDDDLHVEMRFLEWFIFDWQCPQSGRSLIEIFLNGFLGELIPEDVIRFEGFKKNVFSFFEVLEVRTGRMGMRDLSTDKHYDVLEYLGSFQLKAHDVLIARLLPWKKQWVLSGPAIPLRAETAYLIKRDFLHMRPSQQAQKINALTVHQILSSALKAKQAGPQKQPNLPQIRKQMGRALERCMVKDPISLVDLETWIRNDRPDEEIRQELIQRTHFKDTKEIEQFFGVYQEFANNLPRKSRAGFSPKELVEIAPPGPKEKVLIEDLMHSAMQRINPNAYKTAEDRQKALELFQETWPHERQDELEGKSPYEVILEERKSLGNLRTDFSIRMNVSAIPIMPYSSEALFPVQEKDVPLLGDLKRLLEFCGGNTAVRSMREKDRLFRQMENHGNFIQLEYRQDAEEYCDFLLALSEPARQLFERKFPVWEILCKLTVAWCTELKWENFQQGALLKGYAKQFQRDLSTTLSHFGELAEKKRRLNPRDLAYKMFASKREMLNKDRKMCETLCEVMRSVLMRYFLWFGILAKKGFADHSTYSANESGWALFVKLFETVCPERFQIPGASRVVHQQ